MLMRVILTAPLFLLAACEDTFTPASTPTATPSSLLTSTPTTGPSPIPLLYTGYLTAELAPCTPVPGAPKEPCEPDAPQFGGAAAGLPDLGDEPRTVEHYLTGGSI